MDNGQLISWAFAIPGENLNFWVADYPPRILHPLQRSPWAYNGAQRWPSPLALDSGPMRSRRRLARAAWAKFTARVIHD